MDVLWQTLCGLLMRSAVLRKSVASYIPGRVPCPTPVIDPCPTPVIDPCPTPVIDPCPTPEKDLVPPPPDAPIPPVDPTPPADDTPTSSFDDFFNLGSLAGGVGPSTFAFTSGDGATASATATVTVNGETKVFNYFIRCIFKTKEAD